MFANGRALAFALLSSYHRDGVSAKQGDAMRRVRQRFFLII